MSNIAHGLRNVLAFGAILGSAPATPAMAEVGGAKTRLVDCASGSCLRVTGYRASEATAVVINGHAVAVGGARRWQISLPLETVRDWSAPCARTMTVAVAGAEMHAVLPIGLLCRTEYLAFLTVTAR